MKETRVANRYAKALFDLAIEMKVLDRIKDDIELVYSVCKQNRDFVLMLKSPVIKESKKQTIIKEIFKSKVHELTIRFLLVITRNGRESVIMEIAQQFIDVYKKFKNILPVTITSAVQLDADTKKKIIAVLYDRAGAQIELTEEIDKEIIGGFIMEFEDKQYDASISKQIKNLHKEFDINLYIKGF